MENIWSVLWVVLFVAVCVMGYFYGGFAVAHRGGDMGVVWANLAFGWGWLMLGHALGYVNAKLGEHG